MFGSFFDTTATDAFAQWTAAELKKTLSPRECQAGSKRADDRVRKLNDSVARRAGELVTTTRLNVYKKARLGTSLQTMLVDAGYPANFAKQFAYDVAALVATADTARS